MKTIKVQGMVQSVQTIELTFDDLYKHLSYILLTACNALGIGLLLLPHMRCYWRAIYDYMHYIIRNNTWRLP